MSAATNPSLLVDMIGRADFDIANEIGWRDVRVQSEQNMGVIRTTVDGD